MDLPACREALIWEVWGGDKVMSGAAEVAKLLKRPKMNEALILIVQGSFLAIAKSKELVNHLSKQEIKISKFDRKKGTEIKTKIRKSATLPTKNKLGKKSRM